MKLRQQLTPYSPLLIVPFLAVILVNAHPSTPETPIGAPKEDLTSEASNAADRYRYGTASTSQDSTEQQQQQQLQSVPPEECLNGSSDSKCQLGKGRPKLLDDSEAVRLADMFDFLDSQVIPATDDNASQQAPSIDTMSRLDKRLRSVDRVRGNNLLGDIFGTNFSYKRMPPAQTETLKQVFLLHRHGDRTPVSFPPKDQLSEEPFWAVHGLGQLTNRGKERLFLFGRLVRDRYNEFLNKSINKNHRLSRSSGSLRCIESAQLFLASFLQLNLPDTSDAKQLIWDRERSNQMAEMWQPASIQSVPPLMDGMLAESAECKALMDEYTNVIDATPLVREIFANYSREAEVLSQVLGFEMDHFWKWFWASSLVEVESSYFKDKVPQSILSAQKRIAEAAAKAMTAYQSTVKARRLRGGLLISDILNNMKQYRDSHHQQLANPLMNSGVDNQSPTGPKRFFHYSAHDLTVVTLLGILDQWQHFALPPGYASSVIIELHLIDDEWIVKFFYTPEVPGEMFPLRLEACETAHPTKQHCPLDQFGRLMERYTIGNWSQWMGECQNELARVDPYRPGS